MRSREFRRSVRRWRWLIMAGAAIGAVVGWVSAPGASGPTRTFSATHTLFLVHSVGVGSESSRVSGLLATLGPVPDRVAARLALSGQRVRSMVSADSGGPGVLLITGRSDDRTQAEALANVTAEELIVELGGKESPFQTLEPAVATLVDDDIRGPTSRAGRAGILGAFGLLLGVGAVIWVSRFDNRIRSKEAAEGTLEAPVLGEVPPIRPSDRDRLLIGPQPSPVLEAYRRLRTSVDQWTTRAGNGDGRQIIVVSSPVGGEGTTTTVAHLAAAMGEVGRSVLAISADLRHPQLHLYFERACEPGLADVLRGAPDARRLTDLTVTTAIRGVRFVASGAPVRNPSPLLDRIGDHLRDARGMADFVLIDAPPLLTTSDAADLARHADGVLLVVRSGWTSVAAAARSAELLGRLGIPVVGAVLIGSDGNS